MSYCIFNITTVREKLIINCVNKKQHKKETTQLMGNCVVGNTMKVTKYYVI